LARAAHHTNAVALDEHVMIRRRDVDPSLLDRLQIPGDADGHAAGVAQQLRQHSRAVAAAVHDYEERRGKAHRQLRDEVTQRLQPPSGGADADDISPCDGQMRFSPCRTRYSERLTIESRERPRLSLRRSFLGGDRFASVAARSLAANGGTS